MKSDEVGDLRRPAELDALGFGVGPGRSAVIEASAGTGKTYLLEHLVLEVVITGRARLDEILIVTFTERATAELVVRIRQKLDQALAACDAPRRSTAAASWNLDDAARARLSEARRSFDQATIATIHAFCQRILTDEPLATRRLLGQTQVDGRAAFGEVFREVLRRELATDPARRVYLDGYLAGGGGIEGLEELLYGAATARGAWANPYHHADLERLAADLAALDLDAFDLEKTLRKPLHHSSVKALFTRLRRLQPEARAVLETHAWGRFLDCFDTRTNGEMFSCYLETIAALTDPPAVLRPIHRFAELCLRAAPPLEDAVAQQFLPAVEAKLRERKLAEGLYDYDDMIAAVAAAVAPQPGGDGDGDGSPLVDRLRRRYKLALVDEAQDTEPAQWRIFRRIFLESDGPHPVVMIGDPKQAIYGFRGADVHTYVQAREEIRARGGTVLSLARNYRSHPEVVAAYNAILDHDAEPRFFSGAEIAYDSPVTAAKPALGTGPGVTLFEVEAPADRQVTFRIGTIKQALRDEVVTEIQRLRAADRGVALSEIHVLTRSNAEAREVATRLHEAGVPNVLYKPDYIFETAEAGHVRSLLLAIAQPADRTARLGAWLTPFFDVRLADLERCADPPPDHPLVARLSTWSALAERRAYDELWARILDDSGVARRLRLSPAGLRRLTNYRLLFDVLHGEATARPLSVDDLAALLATYAAGCRRPARADDDTQRLETEADAVRIMTIHAAKGLEADFVFIYGGLTGGRFWRGTVHALRRERERLRCAGKPRRQRDIDLIDAGRHEEEQRLLYVAMTRVRKHLYLPFFPAIEAGEVDGQGERGSGDFDPFRKISGAFRHINQRLRVLAADPARVALFRRRSISVAARPPRDEAAVLAAIGSWTPRAAEPAAGGAQDERETAPEHEHEREHGHEHEHEHGHDDVTARLRARRRGFAITSYSRLSEAEGGYHPPHMSPDASPDASSDASSDDAPDARAVAKLDRAERLELEVTPLANASGAAAGSSPDALPGGLASGLFLHGILEKAALGELPPLASWRAQPDVRQLVEAESRRWEAEPRHFDEATRLVHAALTVPLSMPGGAPLRGISRAARVRREVDFLFPLPVSSATRAAPSSYAATAGADAEERRFHERGFVRGALDVLFEHEGRLCFADWKSNVLPSFTAAAVREHVALNYQLQVQIYTLALVRMLGITTAAAYDRRFGGLAYIFLRGLKAGDRATGDGLYIHRPDYEDVQRWSEDLAARHVAGAGDLGDVEGVAT